MSEAPFLGRGWSFPPRFSAGGADVHTVAGEEDVYQSLQILLSTGLGERVMQASYGCDLSSQMFEEVNRGMINRVTALVEDAILYHEPRIALDGVDVSASDSRFGVLEIRVDYTVRSTNSRFNLVFPFYLEEAGAPVA